MLIDDDEVPAVPAWTVQVDRRGFSHIYRDGLPWVLNWQVHEVEPVMQALLGGWRPPTTPPANKSPWAFYVTEAKKWLVEKQLANR